MKKALKITGISLGVLLALILVAAVVLPIAFKGKIREIVLREGNAMLDARFDFESVGVSLLRNFPQATLSVKGFSLWGVGDFAADTLASVERLSTTVSPLSLFSDEGFNVSRVLVDGARVRAIVLEDGRPNWDIMKPSDTPEAEADSTAAPSSFRVQLKNLTIRNTDVVFDDRQAGMYAAVQGLDVRASGDLGAERTTLRIGAGIPSVTFRYGGIPYLSDATVELESAVEADLAAMQFTLTETTVALNAIRATIEGSLGMAEEGAIDVDVRLGTDRIDFKDILSMIPAIYTKDFDGLEAAGTVALTAWAKGRMVGERLPAFEASVEVTGGSFRYPSLPAGVEGIRIAASAKNPGGSADATTLAVQPLAFTLAGNPFSATLDLATPLSDPAFAVTARGVLDLGKVGEVYPLDSLSLNGVLEADLDLSGRLSYVERGQYDRFAASGTLRLSDMLIQMTDLPDVAIARSLFTFTPAYLQLSETRVAVGRSDVTLDSRLENYMAFALKGETIRGTLDARSELLDLNELMGHGETTAETLTTDPETASTPAFEVPKNIDFQMNVALAKVYFDNLELDDVAGRVSVGGGKLDMSNLSLNTLQGSVVVGGYYSTADDPARPELVASLDMSGLSFSETFDKFVTIRRLAPIFEGLAGTFSGKADIRARMDSLMNVDYTTLAGEGSLRTGAVSLSGIGALDAIADAVNRPELKNISVRDLDLPFTIAAGRVSTAPFDLRIGSDMNLNLSGSTGIDQTIDYTGKLKLPASAGFAAALTTVDLRIGGTFAAPKVSVDMAGMAQQAVENLTDMAAGRAVEEIGNVLGVDLSDAESQRAALIEQATTAGARLVEEAQRQADALVERASGPLAVVGARVAAAKLVEEAQRQADNLVAKATEQGDALVERARAGGSAE